MGSGVRVDLPQLEPLPPGGLSMCETPFFLEGGHDVREWRGKNWVAL